MGGCAANYKLSPKAPKISVFSSKYLIFFFFFDVLETKGVGVRRFENCLQEPKSARFLFCKDPLSLISINLSS